MCRGCELENHDDFFKYLDTYEKSIVAIKDTEKALLALLDKAYYMRHRKRISAHHKRLVRLRRELGKLDGKFTV